MFDDYLELPSIKNREKRQ